MEAFSGEAETHTMDSVSNSTSADQSLHEASSGAPVSCMESTAESEVPTVGPPADMHEGGAAGSPGGGGGGPAPPPDDLSKPWGLHGEEGGPRGFEQHLVDGFNSEKLHQFRAQLHQLSRQKDGLMPRPGK
ncbi:hypothetical protein ACSSS7_003164 [Eimeria intestinalis]